MNPFENMAKPISENTEETNSKLKIECQCDTCRHANICKYKDSVQSVNKSIMETLKNSGADLPIYQIDVKCEHYSDPNRNLTLTGKTSISSPVVTTRVNTLANEVVSKPEKNSNADSIVDAINSNPEKASSGSNDCPPHPDNGTPDWYRPVEFYGKLLNYSEAYSCWRNGNLKFCLNNGNSYFIII